MHAKWLKFVNTPHFPHIISVSERVETGSA